MRNRIHKSMRNAKGKGMSNTEILLMREIAKKEAKKMELEATEKALLYMLAIPLSILFNDYWQKSAKKRAPKFIEEVMKYFWAVIDGQVSEQELVDTLYDLAGVKITADWLEGVRNGTKTT